MSKGGMPGRWQAAAAVAAAARRRRQGPHADGPDLSCKVLRVTCKAQRTKSGPRALWVEAVRLGGCWVEGRTLAGFAESRQEKC